MRKMDVTFFIKLGMPLVENKGGRAEGIPTCKVRPHKSL
jgi:hypothetical protein